MQIVSGLKKITRSLRHFASDLEANVMITITITFSQIRMITITITFKIGNITVKSIVQKF